MRSLQRRRQTPGLCPPRSPQRLLKHGIIAGPPGWLRRCILRGRHARVRPSLRPSKLALLPPPTHLP
eukprot:5826933-Alexandrium_andersonii.AAC.1